MTILGLQLTTDRLAQMRDFYSQMLQLALVEEREDTLAFQVGMTKLMFTVAEADTQPAHAFGFSVPAARFDAVTDALSQRMQLYAPEQRAGSDTPPTVYLNDPSNNAISLVARDEIVEDREQSNPLSLCAVGELTFVVDDVQSVRHALETRFEFSAFPSSSGTRVMMRGVDTTLNLVPRGETLLPDGGAQAGVFPIAMTLAGTVNAVDRLGEYPYFIYVADVTGSPGVTGARVEARPV